MKFNNTNVSKVIQSLHENCESELSIIDDRSIRQAAKTCDFLDIIGTDELDLQTAIEYIEDLRDGFETICNLIVTLYKDETKDE